MSDRPFAQNPLLVNPSREDAAILEELTRRGVDIAPFLRPNAHDVLNWTAESAKAGRAGMRIALPPDPRRDHLLGFVRAMMADYHIGPMHRLLASKLERAVRTATGTLREGEEPLKRLLISTPPRHGKTQLASRFFPAWVLGNFPDSRVITTSYSADLAFMNSAHVRAAVMSPAFQRIFPHVQMDPLSRRVDMWGLKNWRGGLRAAGVGGGITGFGAHIFIVDDPFKDRKDANSALMRETVWGWYTSTAHSRLEGDNAVMICIMCMTGDTPVMLESGAEKPLSEIRTGDRIATYDGGRLGVSTVRNWKDQGPDFIFRIKTKSGKVVKANARHPFLVESEGGVEWRRTATLKKGDRILRVTGANGEESPAPQRAATSPQGAKGYATRTTPNNDGRQEYDRQASTRRPAEKPESGTDTESFPRSTTAFSPSRAASARSAKGAIPAGITTSSASTIATPPERSEGSFATTATSSSAKNQPRRGSSPPPNICDFIGDEIVEIEAAGVDRVFDIEVENTGNFIANGLVSHNTRWHEDDLVGRLLANQKRDPNADRWEFVWLKALSEEPDPNNEWDGPDLLGRKPGESLWPEKFTPEYLATIKALNPDDWDALWQGRPTPPEGVMFRREWFTILSFADFVKRKPTRFVRFWDLAISTRAAGDYTAGALCATDDKGNLYIVHMERFKKEWPDAKDRIKETARDDFLRWACRDMGIERVGFQGAAVQEMESDPDLMGITIKGVRPDTDKRVRAAPWAARAKAGKVFLVEGDWIQEFLHEIGTFVGVNDTHDDQVDAVSYGNEYLVLNGWMDPMSPNIVGMDPEVLGATVGDGAQSPQSAAELAATMGMPVKLNTVFGNGSKEPARRVVVDGAPPAAPPPAVPLEEAQAVFRAAVDAIKSGSLIACSAPFWGPVRAFLSQQVIAWRQEEAHAYAAIAIAEIHRVDALHGVPADAVQIGSLDNAAEAAAIRAIEAGQPVDTTADRWPAVRRAIQERTGRWIEMGDLTRLKLAHAEIQRLDAAFKTGV